MLLSISTTHTPATDLGYLLHKHPDRVHKKPLNFGQATLFFAQASEQRATAVLVVDVDPVGLVRRENEAFALSQYVNDRPFAASSFLSVALGAVLGSALGGRCRDKPELAVAELPWEIHIAALPCGANGEELLKRLFEPLGFAVRVQNHPFNFAGAQDLNWGVSRYADVFLSTRATLQSVLQQLYVLIPVLDADKHYWIGADEVEKLLRKSTSSSEENGASVSRNWLANHPEREFISRRYLRNQRGLVQQALERLQLQADAELETETEHFAEAAADSAPELPRESREEKVEKPLGLNALRLDAIAGLIAELQVSSVLDLGCGEGKLLRKLMSNKRLTRLLGVDVAMRELQRASARLKLDELPERERQRIALLQGSLIYRDQRLSGFDAATVIEVIEHLDPHRLEAFANVLFAHIGAKHVLLSTPNVEFNVRFANLGTGLMRHPDHRFEWSRAQFQCWAKAQAEKYAYQVRFLGIGEMDEELGPPTQLAHFYKPEPGVTDTAHE